MKSSLEELRAISRNLALEGDFCRAEAVAEAADDLEALQAQLDHMGFQLMMLRDDLDAERDAHQDTMEHADRELSRMCGND